MFPVALSSILFPVRLSSIIFSVGLGSMFPVRLESEMLSARLSSTFPVRLDSIIFPVRLSLIMFSVWLDSIINVFCQTGINVSRWISWIIYPASPLHISCYGAALIIWAGPLAINGHLWYYEHITSSLVTFITWDFQ